MMRYVVVNSTVSDDEAMRMAMSGSGYADEDDATEIAGDIDAIYRRHPQAGDKYLPIRIVSVRVTSCIERSVTIGEGP